MLHAFAENKGTFQEQNYNSIKISNATISFVS